jgi:hypothetical protein
MDRDHQGNLRGRVREVRQDAEDVHGGAYGGFPLRDIIQRTNTAAFRCGLAQEEDWRPGTGVTTAACGRGYRRYSSLQPRHPYTTKSPITDHPINYTLAILGQMTLRFPRT